MYQYSSIYSHYLYELNLVVALCVAVQLLAVTSRKVVWLFFEQLRSEFVPVFHRLQGRSGCQC